MECPICGGALMYLGALGWNHWYSCRSCGMDVNIPDVVLRMAEEEDDDVE